MSAAGSEEIDVHLETLSPVTLADLATRAQLEDRFRKGTLSAEDRLRLLAEPLHALEPLFRPKHTSPGGHPYGVGDGFGVLKW